MELEVGVLRNSKRAFVFGLVFIGYWVVWSLYISSRVTHFSS